MEEARRCAGWIWQGLGFLLPPHIVLQWSPAERKPASPPIKAYLAEAEEVTWSGALVSPEDDGEGLARYLVEGGLAKGELDLLDGWKGALK